jgi:hypothetical protein
MILIRPNKDEVESYVGIHPIKPNINKPSKDKNEWNKDHKNYVLKTLLPKIEPSKRVWRIVAEAYLTRVKLEETDEIKSFEEVLCDGSSFVPDLAYKWGRIKDPWAMGHDLIYLLNKFNLKDVYGNTWSYKNAQDMYRDGWYSQNFYVIGFVRWIGLMGFGWVSWNKKFDNNPEPIRYIVKK